MSHSHPLPTVPPPVPPLAAGQSRRHGYADGMKRTEDSANSSAGRRRRGTPSTSSGLAGLLCLARDRSPLAATFPDSPSLTTHPPTRPTTRTSPSSSPRLPTRERRRLRLGTEQRKARKPSVPVCQPDPSAGPCLPSAVRAPIKSEAHDHRIHRRRRQRSTHTHTRPLRPRCSRVAGPDRDEARSAALGSPRAR